MPTVNAGPGALLHYYDEQFTDPWRAPSTVLLQHGFSRSGRFWYNWVPPLARDFRVLRPDMRGMGLSALDPAAYEPSLETFAADVCRTLDHAGIDRTVFVGESFGGIIGLQFAHSYPERVQALVLCNTPCRLPKDDLRRRFSDGGDWDDTLRRGVGAWSTATIDMRLDTRVASQGLKDWYISEMDRTAPEIGLKLQGYLDQLDFSPRLKEITVPTLLLVGEESPTSTLEQQRFIQSEIPDCRLEVYPGLGHGINALQPEWCVLRVREFLGLRNIG